jgi:hypothetical protein
MPLNGETSADFGVYQSVCCGAEIVIAKGGEFPTCPNHPKASTSWNPILDDLNRDSSKPPAA